MKISVAVSGSTASSDFAWRKAFQNTSIAGVLVYLAFTLLLLRQSARNRIDEPIWFIVLLFVFAAAILLFGRGVAEWLGV